MTRDIAPPSDLQRGRRASARLRLRLAARLVLRGGTQRCVLVDLSTSGAHLMPNEAVRVGEQAVLQWDARLEAFGEIVWTDARQCGILFDAPLSPAVLQATRDLDATDRLPPERDLVRASAWAFVKGAVRL